MRRNFHGFRRFATACVIRGIFFSFLVPVRFVRVVFRPYRRRPAGRLHFVIVLTDRFVQRLFFFTITLNVDTNERCFHADTPVSVYLIF